MKSANKLFVLITLITTSLSTAAWSQQSGTRVLSDSSEGGMNAPFNMPEGFPIEFTVSLSSSVTITLTNTDTQDTWSSSNSFSFDNGRVFLNWEIDFDSLGLLPGSYNIEETFSGAVTSSGIVSFPPLDLSADPFIWSTDIPAGVKIVITAEVSGSGSASGDFEGPTNTLVLDESFPFSVVSKKALKAGEPAKFSLSFSANLTKDTVITLPENQPPVINSVVIGVKVNGTFDQNATAYTNSVLGVVSIDATDDFTPVDNLRKIYQWKKNGGDIPGATGTTLDGTKFNKGDNISLQLIVMDGSGNFSDPKVSNTITIAALPPAKVTVAPERGSIGTKVKIYGSNFLKARKVTITFGTIAGLTAVTDSSGAFSLNILLNQILPDGKNAVKASDGESEAITTFFYEDTTGPLIKTVNEDSQGEPKQAGDVIIITVEQAHDFDIPAEARFSLGNITDEPLYNDGTHGDVKAGDTTWTRAYEVASQDAADRKPVVAVLVDNKGNASTKESLTLVKIISIYTVSGTVSEADVGRAEGLEVIVVNQRTKQGKRALIKAGKYSVTFSNFTSSAVQVGDVITLTVKRRGIVALKSSHTVTTQEVGAGFSQIKLQFPSLQTNMLIVTGQVLKTENRKPVADGIFTVKVLNTTTGISADAGDVTKGRYSLTLTVPQGQSMMEDGNEIVVSVADAADNLVRKVQHILTREEVESKTATIDIMVSNRPPLASSGGPYTGEEGKAIIFDASKSSDPDGDSIKYRWDWDNDGKFDTGFSSSSQAIFTWEDEVFSQTVRLEVSDGLLTHKAQTTATVKNVAPQVVIEEPSVKKLIREGDIVSFVGKFTDPGKVDTHTIDWDFGDGKKASGTLTPKHKYEDNEEYTVTLMVRDNDGGEGKASLFLVIDNVPPVAKTTGPYQTLRGVPITLQGMAEDMGKDTFTFRWDFNNDDKFDDAEGQSPIFENVSTSGIFPIALQVTDDDGGVSSPVKIEVRVLGITVEVVAKPKRLLADGKSVSILTATVKDEERQPITDEEVEITVDAVPVIPVTNRGNGTYTANYTAETPPRTTKETPVSVTAKAIMANIKSPPFELILIPQLHAHAGTQYEVREDEPLTLDGSQSSGLIVAYNWDLNNDGEFDEAMGATPNVTFTKDGTFPIKLKVIDANGVSKEASATVIVKPVNDRPKIEPPIVPISTNEDSPITVDLKSHQWDEDDVSTSLTWQVSGGDISLFAAEIADGFLTITPVPNKFGEATITLTLRDSGGRTAAQEAPVTIISQNDAPEITPPIPQISIEQDKPLSIELRGHKFDVDNNIQDLTWEVVNKSEALFDATIKEDTLTIHPKQGQFGEGELTLILRDPAGGSVRQDVKITILGKPRLQLKITPDTLTADGKSQSQITVIFSRPSGEPITDDDVKLTITSAPAPRGVLSAVTNQQNGAYTATYTASTKVGVVQLTAQSVRFNIQSEPKEITLSAGEVTKLTILPEQITLEEDATQQFSVSGEDLYGNSVPLKNTDVNWTVKDTNIGKVDSNGLFTATGFGKTIVTAVLKKNPSIRQEARIEIPDTEPPTVSFKQLFPNLKNQNVPITSSIRIVFSESIELNNGIKITGGNDRKIEGKFDDSNIAEGALIFKPQKHFKDEETVTVTISTAVEDLAKNKLKTKFIDSFTTGIGLWPGDANNNGQVNILDILPLGQYWHKTGPSRDEENSNWLQPAVPWKPDKMATYADTDGNGEVNKEDIMPIALNWKRRHTLNRLAPQKIASEEGVSYNPKLLNIYEAMYNVLQAAPFETEGVRALKNVLGELIANIKRQLTPRESKLLQNYPNPFNPETWIPYQLAEGAFVRINIYDVSGRLVRTLQVGQKPAGYYLSKERAAYWNGRNQIGERVTSGVYFYHLQAGKFENIKKLINAK